MAIFANAPFKLFIERVAVERDWRGGKLHQVLGDNCHPFRFIGSFMGSLILIQISRFARKFLQNILSSTSVLYVVGRA